MSAFHPFPTSRPSVRVRPIADTGERPHDSLLRSLLWGVRMPIGSKKRTSLVFHKLMIERTLDDMRAGRKVDHLAESELLLLIKALEKRLASVCDRLSAYGDPEVSEDSSSPLACGP